MAILWSKRIEHSQYEVRTAGATRRLYTNSVFHSQLNPNKKLQGGIWDLLSLAAFAFEQASLQRVLVLGVGGGTVLYQIQTFFSPKKIIGVELNPVHISIAKKFFNINHKSIQLIEADAIKWLQEYKDEKFDLIIDDLFGHHDGEAERVIALNKQWVTSLKSQLKDKGVLVVNFGSNKEFKNSACVSYKKIANQFTSIIRLSLTQYENAIGIFSREKINISELKANFNNKMGLTTKIKRSNFKCFFEVFK